VPLRAIKRRRARRNSREQGAGSLELGDNFMAGEVVVII
jgi:hypothetical protein